MPNPNDPPALPPSERVPYTSADTDAVTRLERRELTGHSALTPTVVRGPAPPPARTPSARSANSLLKLALIAVAGLLTVMLAAALTVLLRPQSGDLVVNVSGAGGEVIEGLSITIDGERRCTKVPCRVSGLIPGAHGVKADGHGYGATAERHVIVEDGRQALLDLVLPPDPATGVRVTAKGSGFRLNVDGREVGTVPREVGSLAPGEHTLKISGNPAFAELEKKVLVPAGQLVDVELAPPVIEGTLRLKAGANAGGAEIFLQVGEERRRLHSLRKSFTLRADPQAVVVATKKGFDEFSRPVEFPPGEAELVMVIDLVKSGTDAEEAEPAPAPVQVARGGRSRVSAARSAADDDEAREAAALNADPYAAAKAKGAQPAAAGAMGKVSVNSIPVSNVTLNGRDIGSTPKMGIEVPAGPVTAVFKHPELGTLTRSGVVKAGGNLTLSVKFPTP